VLFAMAFTQIVLLLVAASCVAASEYGEICEYGGSVVPCSCLVVNSLNIVAWVTIGCTFLAHIFVIHMFRQRASPSALLIFCCFVGFAKLVIGLVLIGILGSQYNTCHFYAVSFLWPCLAIILSFIWFSRGAYYYRVGNMIRNNAAAGGLITVGAGQPMMVAAVPVVVAEVPVVAKPL